MAKNTKYTQFYEEDWGDGLYWSEGDLHCCYPVKKTETSDSYMKFYYDKFTVTVKFTTTQSDGKTTKEFVSVERTYST